MIPPGDAGAAASAPSHREAIALAWERVAVEAGCTEREAAHWALLALETLSYPADVHEYREGIIQHNDEQARFREGIKRVDPEPRSPRGPTRRPARRNRGILTGRRPAEMLEAAPSRYGRGDPE